MIPILMLHEEKNCELSEIAPTSRLVRVGSSSHTVDGRVDDSGSLIGTNDVGGRQGTKNGVNPHPASPFRVLVVDRDARHELMKRCVVGRADGEGGDMELADKVWPRPRTAIPRHHLQAVGPLAPV